jgi:hypothetical protein
VLAIRAGQTLPVRPNQQFLLQTMQAQTLAVYREVLS